MLRMGLLRRNRSSFRLPSEGSGGLELATVLDCELASVTLG
jgi:hypothetical protein